MTKHTTQNVTKLKKFKCDKTQKFEMWQNSKTQNVKKLKNSKCDKILKNICDKNKKI